MYQGRLETASQMRVTWEKAALDGKLKNSQLQEKVIRVCCLCVCVCICAYVCVCACACVCVCACVVLLQLLNNSCRDTHWYTCQIMELEYKLRQVQDKGAAPASRLVDEDAVAEQRRAAEQALTDQLAQRGASLSSSSVKQSIRSLIV